MTPVSSAAPGTAPSAGDNAAAYLLQRRLDAGEGDRVAIRCQGRDHTYAALSARVEAAAAALLRDGVRAEERLLILLPDSPEWVVAFLGALRAGVVAVPVSTMLTAADLAFLAADSRARAAVVDRRFAATAQGLALSPRLHRMVVAGEAGPAPAERDGLVVEAWEEWIGRPTPGAPAAATTADETAFWLYTSGTTGSPKGAMHRHADVPFVCSSYGGEVLGITREDRTFSVARLFFAYGLGNAMLFPFSAGATSVLDPRPPTPATVVETLRAERPTLFFATPTFFAALLAAEVPREVFASVRHCVSAGETLPEAVYERFLDRTGVQIVDGIGSTEALHIFLSNRPGQPRAGTTGTVVPGYGLRLVDDEGAEVDDGTDGHLLVRGESLCTGYWNRTAVNRRTFLGDWMRTGDVFVRDAAGAYTYRGRSDDMLKSGGIWVSPAEIEGVLVQHPEVLEAAVVGARDPEDGVERPVAHVVRMPGSELTEDALVAFVRERLAPFKRPRRVLFAADLPKTATGKIQRYRLRG